MWCGAKESKHGGTTFGCTLSEPFIVPGTGTLDLSDVLFYAHQNAKHVTDEAHTTQRCTQ